MRTLRLSQALLSSVAAFAATAAPSKAEPHTAQGAAAPAASGASDIIITARRQRERALDVPISVSEISGKTLDEKGVYTLEDVQRQAPSVTAYQSNARNSSIGVR